MDFQGLRGSQVSLLAWFRGLGLGQGSECLSGADQGAGDSRKWIPLLLRLPQGRVGLSRWVWLLYLRAQASGLPRGDLGPGAPPCSSSSSPNYREGMSACPKGGQEAHRTQCRESLLALQHGHLGKLGPTQ